MNIVVCEDDPLYRKSIPEKIIKWSHDNGCADVHFQLFSSSEDFLEEWNKGIKSDILFLDIQFKFELDGMEVARQVRATDMHVPIVFITNSDAYIRDGYTVSALRYLSKPVSYEDIAPCLDIAYKQYTLSHNEFFILSDAGKRIAIRHAEILYFEARSPYSLIYLRGESQAIKLRYRFSDFLQKLPEELFIPCHRSYIVNLMHIRGLKRTELLLSNGERLPISRAYVASLSYAFDSYYQEGCEHIHVDSI